MISASGAWLAAVPSSGIPALCHRSMVAIHTTAKYWSVLPHQTPAPQGPVAMRPLRIHHLGSLWSSWNTIFLNDKSINDGHQSRSKPNATTSTFTGFWWTLQGMNLAPGFSEPLAETKKPSPSRTNFVMAGLASKTFASLCQLQHGEYPYIFHFIFGSSIVTPPAIGNPHYGNPHSLRLRQPGDRRLDQKHQSKSKPHGPCHISENDRIGHPSSSCF